MSEAHSINWESIENGDFPKGSKEYIIQKHLRNRQEILKKHESVIKTLNGVFDYAPLEVELKKETRRFKQELDAIVNAE